MHYALQDCKRLLHYDSDYDFWIGLIGFGLISSWRSIARGELPPLEPDNSIIHGMSDD